MAAAGDGEKLKTILVVDDHEIVRDGIERIIASQIDGHVPKAVGSYGDAIDAVHGLDVALVITDLAIQGRGGLDLILEIASIKPRLPVLVFSMHSERDYGLRAVKCGAWGYVQKNQGVSELIKAIREVLLGNRYVSADLANSLMSFFRKDGDQSPHERLSTREFQILCKLTSGTAIKEIANELCLSVKTVSTYRARIFVKLGVKSIAELVRYALDHNLE